MRVVVVGATGNVGTSVVEVLAGDEQVDTIVGIARRRPKDDFARRSCSPAWGSELHPRVCGQPP
ncbi:hypothetical protein [Mycolicibacterium elephantis]